MIDIFKQVKADIDERRMWEDRQGTAYNLRYCQVKRRQKPFKNAADFSWPLIDGFIDRLKPAYVEQALGPDQVCSFLSKNKQADGFTTQVGQWFDYRVRKRSNFEMAIMHVIDQLLQGGKGFLKTYWDDSENCVRHQSISPPLFVVPPWTEDLEQADRACHIMHMSALTYRRVGEKLGYNMDEDFIKSISGRGEEKMYELAKELREGIAWHKKEDMIILWEVYERLPSRKLKVHTFSPMHPEENLRASFLMPYNHGQIPVVSYDFEITDPGFYSTRGGAEILALYQSILKMLMDSQFDYIYICGRPVFKPGPNNPPTNYENIELVPGQVIDADIVPIEFPPPAVDFFSAESMIQSIAEQRVSTPDYDIGDHQKAGKGRKTATELDQLGAVKQSSVNLRARPFSISITRTFKMQWSLELQYGKGDLDYFYNREFKTLDEGALRDYYELEPNAGKDGYSREKRTQVLLTVRETFRGSPFVDEGELTKAILENIDPHLVKMIYIPAQVNQNRQMEEQAIEIGAMKIGFNPSINPEDNDLIHIQAIEVFKQYARGNPPAQVGPDVQIRIVQHEDAHIAALKHKNPMQYKANEQMLRKIEHDNKATMHQIIQAIQQEQQQAGPVPGPQAGVMPAPTPPAGLRLPPAAPQPPALRIPMPRGPTLRQNGAPETSGPRIPPGSTYGGM